MQWHVKRDRGDIWLNVYFENRRLSWGFRAIYHAVPTELYVFTYSTWMFPSLKLTRITEPSSLNPFIREIWTWLKFVKALLISWDVAQVFMWNYWDFVMWNSIEGDKVESCQLWVGSYIIHVCSFARVTICIYSIYQNFKKIYIYKTCKNV